MIRKWSIENFKSISDKVSLPMEPLTVFAGANSSGKSTIIQSILLTAQTIQNPVLSKSVVLNGHVARFGTFNDIVSDSDPGKNITIDFSLSADYDFAENIYYSNSFIHSLPETVKTVDCSFSFSCKGALEETDALQLQPKLERVAINIQKELDNKLEYENIVITKSYDTIENKMSKFGFQKSKTGQLEIKSTEFDVTNSNNFSEYKKSFRIPKKGEVTGATMSHFLPQRLTLSYDIIEEHARNFIDQLIGGSQGSYPYHFYERSLKYDFSDDIFLTKSFRRLFLEILNSFIDEDDMFLREPRHGENAKTRLIEALRLLNQKFSTENMQKVFSIPLLFKRILLQRLTEKSMQLKNAALEGASHNYVLESFPLPSLISHGTDIVRTTFHQNLKYLGPLRDEPKSMYPLSTNVDSMHVGFKGEYTASVLDAHKNTIVEYIPTKNLNSEIREKVTLIEAVLDWLEYMGIAKNVATADKGKLGHELKVSISGGSMHELTHVGVGVSQVLPILVLSLLGQSQSILIFEQPELHLHPRVQTRLADFFISMTKLKKQCIIETHSEYFINRLRYNVAISDGSHLSNDIIMYFVEKKDGQSNYRPVMINKYGVIDDWPDGFFDEAEDISSSILRAAMDKKRREKSNG